VSHADEVAELGCPFSPDTVIPTAAEPAIHQELSPTRGWITDKYKGDYVHAQMSSTLQLMGRKEGH
jgi:hypothetical protein